jgi:hypothetical protein
MDELPSNARAMLELARDGHDPPDDSARARVRRRVALALAAPAVAGALGGGKSATSAGAAAGGARGIGGSWLGVKGWVAAALVVAGVGGATIIASNRSSDPRPAAPAADARAQAPAAEVAQPAPDPQPRPAAQASSAESAGAVPVASSGRRPGRNARGALRAGASMDLTRETELLSRAAQLLTQRDVAGARALLDEHRRSFRRPLLREEREGLLVLGRCVEDPSAAREQARVFLARAPASVLVARIASACALSASE